MESCSSPPLAVTYHSLSFVELVSNITDTSSVMSSVQENMCLFVHCHLLPSPLSINPIWANHMALKAQLIKLEFFFRCGLSELHMYLEQG